MGAISVNAGTGFVYTYNWNVSSQAWILITSTTVPLISGQFQYFGAATTLNGAGTLLVVGANAGNGVAYTYNWNNSSNVWVNRVSANVYPANYVFYFGSSAALNNDGTILCVSEPGSGSIYKYIYNNTSNSWVSNTTSIIKYDTTGF